MAIKSIGFLRPRVYVKHKIIKDLVKDRTVIHYGCVDDDKELIRHKLRAGNYLHKLVTDNAKRAIGIDSNKNLFGFLKNELSIDNVVYGNVEDPNTFDIDKKILKAADIVLIPDLIEHLNNPGKMLAGIKDYFAKEVKLIIVTPNPHAWYNFGATLLNREIYSPYHTLYFTTESMSVLLSRHGFKIDRILPVVSPKQRGTMLRQVDKAMSKISTFISPGFADLYLYECSVKK